MKKISENSPKIDSTLQIPQVVLLRKNRTKIEEKPRENMKIFDKLTKN